MVFVKVRETYDLATKSGKMTTLCIHTPKADIIKKSYPGLLLQCRAYRPVSCDVVCACASVQAADPLQVGVTAGDIAPEDLFNPILYKPMGNFGMSQLEARINYFLNGETGLTVDGETVAGRDDVSNLSDEFDLYYGLLSDTHSWRHANPQAGFQMRGLRPMVYEMLHSVGDVSASSIASSSSAAGNFRYPVPDGSYGSAPDRIVKGNAKPLPMMNTTIYNAGETMPGFTGVVNAETDIPAPQIVVGAVIVPPSRLHELYFRMVVEWTLEFSMVRQIADITSWGGLANLGQSTHYKNYDYSESKAAAGVDSSTLTSDNGMVAANVEIKKVM